MQAKNFLGRQVAPSPPPPVSGSKEKASNCSQLSRHHTCASQQRCCMCGATPRGCERRRRRSSRAPEMRMNDPDKGSSSLPLATCFLDFRICMSRGTICMVIFLSRIRGLRSALIGDVVNAVKKRTWPKKVLLRKIFVE
jgi:hypothetical protein